LMHMKDEFIRVFREKSNPDHPNNRVKDVREIIRDIRILSTIANALSEECNTKYALKTYYETCEDVNRAVNPVSLFRRGAQKEIYRDLGELSRKIVPFVKKSEEPSQERMALMDKVDGIAGTIYEKILSVEASRALWCARRINILCFKKISKEPMKKWLNSLHGGIDVSGLSTRERKEKLKLEMIKLREHKERIQEISSDRYAIGISIWVGTILTLALTLFFGLKQLGVI